MKCFYITIIKNYNSFSRAQFFSLCVNIVFLFTYLLISFSFMNFGAIGFVLAHELTHSLDDVGNRVFIIILIIL